MQQYIHHMIQKTWWKYPSLCLHQLGQPQGVHKHPGQTAQQHQCYGPHPDTCKPVNLTEQGVNGWLFCVAGQRIVKKKIIWQNFNENYKKNSPDLVFLANSYDFREFTQLPFHAVDTLNNDNDLLPCSACLWLTTSYLLSQDLFQISRGCKSSFTMIIHMNRDQRLLCIVQRQSSLQLCWKTLTVASDPLAPLTIELWFRESLIISPP